MAEQSTSWDRLRELIDGESEAELQAYIDALPPMDVALNVSRLDADHRARLLAVITPDHAAEVVEQMPATQANQAIETLTPDVVAAILEELPSDERADLLEGLDDPTAERILDAMHEEPADETRRLRGYASNVAGGLMTLEYLSYRQDATVREVLADLRANAERYRDFVVQYVFLTDRVGRLVGVLRLRDLLFAEGNHRVGDLTQAEPLAVHDTDTLDELRAFFDRNPYFGAPVLGYDERLVGIVHHEAVREALSDRSADTFRKTQGIVGGEELRTMPLVQRSRRRLAWLSVNIVLNLIAASVIAFHQETLAAVIALAVFLPIVSDMSGCSGNQAVAVSLRELSLGLVHVSELWRVLWSEVKVGLLNGLVLGALLAGVALLWKGNPWLGAVVGAALMLNTVVAVAIGGLVPLVLRRFGADPALASGPILTTVTDLCGFFLLLGLASRALPLLT